MSTDGAGVPGIRKAALLMLSLGEDAATELLRNLHPDEVEKIGEENLFFTLAQAIEQIHPKTHRDTDETECPLTAVCRESAAADIMETKEQG